MTLKQLKYIVAVANNNFNISYTAEKLFTSQPGISKQIKLFEESLGREIFLRNGKTLHGLTPIGQKIVKQAELILSEVESLKQLAADKKTDSEVFNIATTQTQSTFVLPKVIHAYQQRHQGTRLNLYNGNMDQLIDIAKHKTADCIILSSSEEVLRRDWFPGMVMIPCYQWEMVLLCKKNGSRFKGALEDIEQLRELPMVTYIDSKAQQTTIKSVMQDNQMTLNIVATSNDSQLLKDYVRNDVGLGIVASICYDEHRDSDLKAVSLAKYFPKCTTILVLERSNILKPYIYDFIKLFAPHLDAEQIEAAAKFRDDIDVETSTYPKHANSWDI